MPSKPTVRATADTESTGAGAPVEEPKPVVFEPATDDEDEEEPEEQDAPIPPSENAAGLDVAGLIDQFAALMAQREEQIWERIEERLAAIVPPATNGHVKADEEPERVGPPGEYPTWMTMPGLPDPEIPPEPVTRQRRPRMVAFIPKEDPYNPKQMTFKTWVNGREIRAKRGQVMILTAGHGIELAKNGHGNCVDIAAMQGSLGEAAPMAVERHPDFRIADDWDGRPLTNQSSFAVAR